MFTSVVSSTFIHFSWPTTKSLIFAFTAIMLFPALWWFILVLARSKDIVFAACTLLYWKKALMVQSTWWFFAISKDKVLAWLFIFIWRLVWDWFFIDFKADFKIQTIKFLAMKSFYSTWTRQLIFIVYKSHLWVWILCILFKFRTNNLAIFAKECLNLSVTPRIWTV